MSERSEFSYAYLVLLFFYTPKAKETINNKFIVYSLFSFSNLCCFIRFYQLRMILAMRTPKK